MKLEAEVRTGIGRRACQQLQKSGYYPAVIYGRGQAAEPIQIQQSLLDAFTKKHAVRTKPFDLTYGKSSVNVLIKDIKRSTATCQIEHIDFYIVEKNKPITVAVPVKLINTEVAPGIAEGGVLDHVLHELEVKSLPKNIPSSIEVDVAELVLGASLHLADIKLPKGCELNKAVDDEHNPTVVSIKAQKVEEEPVEEAEAAAEEAEAEKAPEQAPSEDAEQESES